MATDRIALQSVRSFDWLSVRLLGVNPSGLFLYVHFS